MKILVTGSQGYIGSVLMSELKQNNFLTKGLDSGFFSKCLLNKFEENHDFIKKDIRNINKEDLMGIDSIIHSFEKI